MSHTEEPRKKRFLKLLFGFSPIKFILWYLAILWVVMGGLAYACIFDDTIDPTSVGSPMIVYQNKP